MLNSPPIPTSSTSTPETATVDGSTKISNDKDADPTSADLARVVAWFDGMPVNLAEELLPRLVEGVRTLGVGAAELRAENERLRSLPFWAGRWVEMDLAERWESERNSARAERDEARTQLAAAQAQLAEARAAHDIDLAEEVTALEAADARLEAVRALVDDYEAGRPGTPPHIERDWGRCAMWTMQHIRAALSAAPQPEPGDECGNCGEPLPGEHVVEYDYGTLGSTMVVHDGFIGQCDLCAVHPDSHPEPPASDEPAPQPEPSPIGIEDRIAQAIGDPGSFLPRGDDYRESVTRWSTRAVMTLVEPLRAENERLTASLAEAHVTIRAFLASQAPESGR